MYSNAFDCHELSCLLYSKLGDQIRFSGSTQQEVVSGHYFSKYRYPHGKPLYFPCEGLPFYFKYCKDGFLRFGVSSFSISDHSTGEKLAALSDFYAVLSEYFGEATVFYTIKDDDEGTLSLQWSFKNQKEEIQRFQDGSYFDDGEIDQLVIIEGNQEKSIKSSIASKIGLPSELFGLVDDCMEDFVKFKTGKKVKIPVCSHVDFDSELERLTDGDSFQKTYEKRN